MSSKTELACVYAALILIDDDIAVTGEKIQALLKAANVDVEPYWAGLFAKSLEGLNPKDLITNVSGSVGVGGVCSGVPAAAATAASPDASAAPSKEEEKKKEEEESESDEDMGFGLFD